MFETRPHHTPSSFTTDRWRSVSVEPLVVVHFVQTFATFPAFFLDKVFIGEKRWAIRLFGFLFRSLGSLFLGDANRARDRDGKHREEQDNAPEIPDEIIPTAKDKDIKPDDEEDHC